MAKVCWLHLSDIHILRPVNTLTGEAFNQKKVLDQFLDFMTNRFPDDQIERPRYLFITGDLAFTGKKNDYDPSDPNRYSVRKMIDKVAGALGIEKKDYAERIFTVAGNHDIDRDSLKEPHIERAFLDIAADDDDLNDLFLSSDRKLRRDEVLARSERYCDFVRELWNEPKLKNEEVLWYRRSIPIDDSTDFHVVGLDSAWLCHSYWLARMKGTDDERKGEPTSHLTLCEAMVDRQFKGIGPDALTIALMHHDYDITRDRNSGIQHLLENKCDFILCGHEHTERWATPTLGRAHKICAGRFYERRGYRNAVNIVQVDTDTGHAKMVTTHYRTDKGGFWVVDRDATGGQAGYTYDSNSGVLKFYLNRADGVPRRAAAAAPSKLSLNATWREFLSEIKPSVIDVTGHVYAGDEADFWYLLDQTSFDRRSDVAGNSFRQKLNSLLNLCIFRLEYSVVRDIFETLAADCQGVDVFRAVLEAMEKEGGDK